VKLRFITEFDRKNLNFRPCGKKFDEKTDYISAGYETFFRESEPGIPAVQTATEETANAQNRAHRRTSIVGDGAAKPSRLPKLKARSTGSHPTPAGAESP
jgi:hypothetical protein